MNNVTWRTRHRRWYRYPDAHGGAGTSRFAWVYGSMGLLFLIVQLLRTGTFYWWALTGAGRLFRGALHRVLNTPMAFLLVKPVGELLAAFTSDQDKVDEALPDAVHLAGACAQIPLQLSALVSADASSNLRRPLDASKTQPCVALRIR